MRIPITLGNGVTNGQPFGADPDAYRQFGLHGHNGKDYPCPINTPIYAPEAGTISVSANGTRDQYSGNLVTGETIVLRGSNYEHWLLHLNQRLVSAGQHVEEGQLIGYSGNTGYSQGPHLHWGTRPLSPEIGNGYRGFINPEEVLRPSALPLPPAYISQPFSAHLQLVRDSFKYDCNLRDFEQRRSQHLGGVSKGFDFHCQAVYTTADGNRYYTDDPQNSGGYNVKDCDHYQAPVVVTPYVPPAAPHPMVRAEKYQLDWEVPTYKTDEDAWTKRGSNGVLKPGTYIVYQKKDKYYNLTEDNMKPGVWINTEDNVPPKVEINIATRSSEPTPAPLSHRMSDMITKAAELAGEIKGDDVSTNWKQCTPVKIGIGGEWVPVKYKSINPMPVEVRSLDGKTPASIPLPPGATLEIISTFIGPDGRKYARDTKLTAAHRFYALPFDLLKPVEAPVRRMDYNRDGDVNISDFIDYGGRLFKSGVSVVSTAAKVIKTEKVRKFVDGIKKGTR